MSMASLHEVIDSKIVVRFAARAPVTTRPSCSARHHTAKGVVMSHRLVANIQNLLVLTGRLPTIDLKPATVAETMPHFHPPAADQLQHAAVRRASRPLRGA
jgi:hypothetical protein